MQLIFKTQRHITLQLYGLDRRLAQAVRLSYRNSKDNEPYQINYVTGWEDWAIKWTK